MINHTMILGYKMLASIFVGLYMILWSNGPKYRYDHSAKTFPPKTPFLYWNEYRFAMPVYNQHSDKWKIVHFITKSYSFSPNYITVLSYICNVGDLHLLKSSFSYYVTLFSK